MTVPALFKEEPVKLILNRRAIAAGLASLMAAPVAASAMSLRQLAQAPLGFDDNAFSGMMSDGLFLPDYRAPMARLVFEDGHTTGWCRWQPNHTRRKGVSYGGHVPTKNVRAVAIECCAPDKNGMPRYTQLEIA